ncbi:MAG: cysteine desulfurase family protein [Pseudomonadota bacterium]
MIYLDYNATAPIRPSVLAAMEGLHGMPLNPSSVHSAGRHAKKLLEDARARIASALSAFPNEVMFVGSATEANTTVLRGFSDRALLVSAVEHASLTKTGALLGAATIAVDENGIVRLDLLEQQLVALGRPALVSVMLANNETGVIQPIADIARIAHAHGALLHCDAVQALGKIPLDWGLLAADMLTLCAHKAGGPVGTGALMIRSDLPIKPLMVGGKQELGRRAGTDNVPAIVGFAQLVSDVAHCPEAAQWLEWRQMLEQTIMAAAPDAVIFGASAERLPNTLAVSMPGVKSETQLMHFDLAGFAVSAGSACSSGRVAASGALLAMGVKPEIAETALRISWGWGTTRAQMDAFAAAWADAYARLAKAAA